MNFLALFVVLAAVGGAFFAAWITSRLLRLPDLAWKVFLVVLCIDFSIVACTFTKPRLGIDLAGGVNLIYGLDESRSLSSVDEINITRDLIPPLVKRIDPSGLMEITVRPSGNNQVEIILPGGDENEAARIKQLLSQAGVLEFRILADKRKEGPLITRALEERRNGVRKIMDEDDPKVEVAEWTEIALNNAGQLRLDPDPSLMGVYTETATDGKLITEVLVLIDPDRNNWVTGDYLSNAAASVDESTRPCVSFAFNGTGAYLFDALTSANLPEGPNGNQKRFLAIVLDKLIQSAPTINSRIGARGQISGNFTREEVDDMVAILKAGSMPAALAHEPLSEVVTDSTYGAASINSGILAMVVSLIAVLAFMIFYYRWAGVIAAYALLLNMLFVVALMLAFEAAFTLPGIAGLVLTVGMAADANVLIYERMREELDRGASLRMAIRQGFAKASTTIIDSNLTSLITATVLYAIGTDQIKGFAVTLWLGVAINLFTAVFCTRVVFDIIDQKRWLRTLSFMKLLDKTNIDFIGLWKPAVVTAAVVIGIGVVATFARGKNILDVDFLGGCSVQVRFIEPQDYNEVRTAVEKSGLPDVIVKNISDADEKLQRTGFIVDTSDANLAAVEAVLGKIFPGKLIHNDVKVGEIRSGTGPAVTNPQSNNSSAASASGWASLLPWNWTSLAYYQDAPAAPAAQTPPAETPATPATPAPAAPATPPAETPAAPAAAPVLENPNPTAPATPATPAPAAEATSAAAPTPPAAPVGTGVVATPAGTAEAAKPREPRYTGGVWTTLEFQNEINHAALSELIQKRLAPPAGSTAAPTSFDVTSKQYREDPYQGYKNWELDLALPADQAKTFLDGLVKSVHEEPFFPAANQIGERVAGNMQQQAALAIIISMIAIIGYIWFRFHRVSYGLAATVAVLHDVAVMQAAIAVSYYVAPALYVIGIEPFKISLAIVAAFLTIIGYSLNDTIVIFDRIREIKGKTTVLTVSMMNRAINETLSRTILTSLTTFMVCMILYIFGVDTVRAFSFALVVGIVSGTFSTVFIACPILIWLGEAQYDDAPEKKGGLAKKPTSNDSRAKV